jgi:hypothetical protein
VNEWMSYKHLDVDICTQNIQKTSVMADEYTGKCRHG